MGEPDPPTPTELVYRRGLDAFMRDDRAAWDATQHPDVECLPADVWPEAGIVVGREALWHSYRGVEDVWEPGEWELTAVEDRRHRPRLSAHVCARQIQQRRGGLHLLVARDVADGMVIRQEWFAERPAGELTAE